MMGDGLWVVRNGAPEVSASLIVAMRLPSGAPSSIAALPAKAST
jgi:hypothetical protein